MARFFIRIAEGVGPSSVAVDAEGTLYVGVYESSVAKSTGTVLIINKDGKLEGTVVTDGAEVSGVLINDGVLIITERSTGSIQKVTL